MAVTYERTTGESIDPRFDRLAEMAVSRRDVCACACPGCTESLPRHCYGDTCITTLGRTTMAEAQPNYADLENARSTHAQRRRADTLALIAAGVEDGRYSLMGREVL